ncbi:MAG: four-carbon acid sugar kinase family protein [Rubrobacter sp.]
MASSRFPEPNESVGTKEYLANQPPARHEPEALKKIRDRVVGSGRRVIVLDDDPTGTQTVHDVPVLTTWSYSELRWALEQPSPTVYVLTNSRGLEEQDAVLLNKQIAQRLSRAAADSGTGFAITSRSDSTLRGHFPAELDALSGVLRTEGEEIDGIVVCPCFLEAGRVTVDDVQWVAQADELVPAALTEFASDATFGYSSSNLANWIEEKTAGEVPAGCVLRVGLEDIRRGGPERVAGILQETSEAQPVVVNATEYADLEVFVLGLLAAEAAGKSFVYRVGPSFVRVRGGIPEKEPLRAEDLYRQRPVRGHGLVLVGSHVRQTTQQLERARRLDGLQVIELSVRRLLDQEGRDEELDRVVGFVNGKLPGADVVVYTSREVVGASGNLSGLGVGTVVSDALVEVARRVDRRLPLGFLVAKGGVTSSDVATRGLGVRRAEVAGQMMPGIVSAWILPSDSDYPGLPYVVFPGNVGGPDALAKVIETLREGGWPESAEQSEREGSL